MIEQLKAAPRWAKWLLAVGVVVVIAAVAGSGGNSKKSNDSTSGNAATTAPSSSSSSGSSSESKPEPDRTVDKNSRRYLDQMTACATAVSIVRSDLKADRDPVSLADVTTKGRDICNDVRDRLLSMPHDHFDDQAAEGWSAIDRYKSGLNAVLAYIDDPRPTKVIEARDKLQQGDAQYLEARHRINQRRHVYGLKAIKN